MRRVPTGAGLPGRGPVAGGRTCSRSCSRQEAMDAKARPSPRWEGRAPAAPRANRGRRPRDLRRPRPGSRSDPTSLPRRARPPTSRRPAASPPRSDAPAPGEGRAPDQQGLQLSRLTCALVGEHDRELFFREAYERGLGHEQGRSPRAHEGHLRGRSPDARDWRGAPARVTGRAPAVRSARSAGSRRERERLMEARGGERGSAAARTRRPGPTVRPRPWVRIGQGRGHEHGSQERAARGEEPQLRARGRHGAARRAGRPAAEHAARPRRGERPSFTSAKAPSTRQRPRATRITVRPPSVSPAFVSHETLELVEHRGPGRSPPRPGSRGLGRAAGDRGRGAPRARRATRR
jgi:hypothetical protein